MFDKVVNNVEKYILRFLLVAVLAFILFQLVNLVQDFWYVTIHYDFEVNILERFPFASVGAIFFDILIAFELMETIKPGLHSIPEKAKLILLIGLIAVTRKLITVDVYHVAYTTEIALALLIISLTAGYFLMNSKSNK